MRSELLDLTVAASRESAAVPSVSENAEKDQRRSHETPLHFLLAVFVAVFVATTLARGAEVRVVPPGSMVEGKTIPEWTGEWWKWIVAFPTNQSPWFDQTGKDATNGQSGPIFFLAGVVNESGAAIRSFTIPEGKYLLFPVINTIANSTGENPWGSVTTDLGDGARFLISTTSELDGTIDGTPFTNLLYTTGRPVTNLFAHRELSPELSIWLPSSSNVFQFFGFELSGTLDPDYGDGYWLMLTPLPLGQHTVRFRGSQGPPLNFTLDLTYHICVEPTDLTDATRSLADRVRSAWLGKGPTQALMVSLDAAEASFASNRLRPGVNQLQAFQEKVRAQLARDNPTLAGELTRTAECAIESATRRLK